MVLARRPFAWRAVLSLVLFFLARLASGQSSLNDVHVTPVEKPVTVATAAYSDPYAGFSRIRTQVELVLVPVTITDDRNRPFMGLDQENFQLFENKKPQAIKNFSTEDTPVSVGILLDVSGSMAHKLDRARDAVLQFCEVANPQDEFFVITFADQPELVTDFTSHTDDIAHDLLTIHAKGQTSLLDALFLGVQKMSHARYARKALLIISDGGDNHSRYTERDVRSAIRESDVSIYGVGTYDQWVSTHEELLGPELMRTLADLTGGQAFALESERDMPDVTRNISNRLRHQYVLAYSPQASAADGKWHKISVKLRLPKKFPFLHVAARPGYYAGAAQ